MTTEALNMLTDSLAAEVVAKAGPKLLEYLEARRVAPEPDPLLSVAEIAEELRFGETKVRELVAMGLLHRAPGVVEIRVRRSVVRAYGLPKKSSK